MKLLNDWGVCLNKEFEKDYYLNLREFLKKEYETATVYPAMNDLFNALIYTSYEKARVVILGQDPYHGQGQAHGLSFSVQPGVKIPPSLKNMYKEMNDDLALPAPNHGCLIEWAEQGVVLLNTVLSVRKGEPNSHKGIGWELFTDKVIQVLNEKKQPVVFILWGRHAASKKSLITGTHHHIIESPHPSPFSARRGFFGSKPFSETNTFLTSEGEEPIDWSLTQEEGELRLKIENERF